MPSRRRPSKHAREHVPLAVDRIQGGGLREERYAGGRWSVRSVTGASATSPYLCPGCAQQIHPVGRPRHDVGGRRGGRHQRPPALAHRMLAAAGGPSAR